MLRRGRKFSLGGKTSTPGDAEGAAYFSSADRLIFIVLAANPLLNNACSMRVEPPSVTRDTSPAIVRETVAKAAICDVATELAELYRAAEDTLTERGEKARKVCEALRDFLIQGASATHMARAVQLGYACLCLEDLASQELPSDPVEAQTRRVLMKLLHDIIEDYDEKICRQTAAVMRDLFGHHPDRPIFRSNHSVYPCHVHKDMNESPMCRAFIGRFADLWAIQTPEAKKQALYLLRSIDTQNYTLVRELRYHGFLRGVDFSGDDAPLTETGRHTEDSRDGGPPPSLYDADLAPRQFVNSRDPQRQCSVITDGMSLEDARVVEDLFQASRSKRAFKFCDFLERCKFHGCPPELIRIFAKQGLLGIVKHSLKKRELTVDDVGGEQEIFFKMRFIQANFLKFAADAARYATSASLQAFVNAAQWHEIDGNRSNRKKVLDRVFSSPLKDTELFLSLGVRLKDVLSALDTGNDKPSKRAVPEQQPPRPTEKRVYPTQLEMDQLNAAMVERMREFAMANLENKEVQEVLRVAAWRSQDPSHGMCMSWPEPRSVAGRVALSAAMWYDHHWRVWRKTAMGVLNAMNEDELRKEVVFEGLRHFNML